MVDRPRSVGCVGFTGTRHGLTKGQWTALAIFMRGLLDTGIGELHHGDCIGADEQTDIIAKSYGISRVAHPSTIFELRANCEAEEVRLAKGPLARNKDIVDETDFLIACPKSREEEQRSGTWATIRYAWKIGRAVVIIYPEGGN